ncbi:MAG: PAS domain-containing protein, partial [Halobaculum sp.]
MWEFDLRERVVTTHGSAMDLFGVAAEDEHELDAYLDRIHHEDRERVVSLLKETTDPRDRFDVEFRVRTRTDEDRPEPEHRWLHSRGVVVDDSGEERRVVGITSDVTERKRRQDELRRKSKALDAAPVGTVITDPKQSDNPIIYVNDRFERVTDYPPEEVLGRNCRFLQGERTAPDQVAALRQAVSDGYPASVELRNYRRDGSEFWNRVDIAPVTNDAGEVVNFVGFQRDITDRKRQAQALEERERILRELHAASRRLLTADDPEDVAETLSDVLTTVFDFGTVSVYRYDEAEGVLRTSDTADAPAGEGLFESTVHPDGGPLWNSYRSGETEVYAHDGQSSAVDHEQLLVVPVGDFGVIVGVPAGQSGGDERLRSDSESQDDGPATADSVAGEVESIFETPKVELVELLAANAAAVFRRIHNQQSLNEASRRLTNERDKVRELSAVVDRIQTIQRRVTDSETRAELESTVCEELVASDHVDFAWIGRPEGLDTDLTPTTWAGDAHRFVDVLRNADGEPPLPAQRAAEHRRTHADHSLPSRVYDAQWAKEAVAYGYRSVLSVPLVYDDVLYGVLTGYATDSDALTGIHEDLLVDVASILGTYDRVLQNRFTAGDSGFVELDVAVRDDRYPLHTLAVSAGCVIRFETVVAVDDDRARLLVTVTDGDPERVREAADGVPSVTGIDSAGSNDDARMTVSVETPFLATEVERHGGRLVSSETVTASGAGGEDCRATSTRDNANPWETPVGDDETEMITRVCIRLPAAASHRPLLQ